MYKVSQHIADCGATWIEIITVPHFPNQNGWVAVYTYADTVKFRDFNLDRIHNLSVTILARIPSNCTAVRE